VLSIIEGEKRLRYQPLATEELMLVTGAATELPEGDVRGVDLADLRLIVPSANNLIRMLLDAEFERAGVPLRPAMEVDSLVTVFGLLSNPGWATILPRSAAREDGSQGDLRWVRLVEPSVRRTLVIASLPQREPSPAAQLLIGHLENALHMASSAWLGHKAP
jgi:DNA-binding transcriptional LysR family regulator